MQRHCKLSVCSGKDGFSVTARLNHGFQKTVNVLIYVHVIVAD